MGLTCVSSYVVNCVLSIIDSMIEFCNLVSLEILTQHLRAKPSPYVIYRHRQSKKYHVYPSYDVDYISHVCVCVCVRARARAGGGGRGCVRVRTCVPL